MNTTDNNRLIAEFMGAEKTHIKSVGDIYCPVPSKNGSEYADKLQFHTSWDWLMPVVSKITRDEQYIENDYREHLLDIVPYGLIEDTYDAVVVFIKQHNK